MMNAPQVSIIMNCLNCAKFLPQTLSSVINQTFNDYEIIFWDNGSTDNSAQIAKEFDSRLRYFYSGQTVPLGAARNLALAQARGKYIAFLDCDDLWRPLKLQMQVELMRSNPELGLVCTDTEFFDGDKVLSRQFKTSPPQRGNVYEALMRQQWISMSSAMITREALDFLAKQSPHTSEGQIPEWFDPKLQVCEEADVFYRIAHDWEVDYIDLPLTVWRVSPGSSTFKKFAQFADETLYILQKHRRLYDGYDAQYESLVNLMEKRSAFQKGIALWRDGKGAQARQLVSPYAGSSPKCRLFWLASFLPGRMFDLLSKMYFALPARWRK